jgi:hypothetical protein
MVVVVVSVVVSVNGEKVGLGDFHVVFLHLDSFQGSSAQNFVNSGGILARDDGIIRRSGTTKMLRHCCGICRDIQNLTYTLLLLSKHNLLVAGNMLWTLH